MGQAAFFVDNAIFGGAAICNSVDFFIALLF